MSISATLANSLTGLTAASRAAQVVSNNVANSMTEGYARRELSLSARQVGGSGAGVQVDGVIRMVDETLLREMRLATAAARSADVAAGFFSDALRLIGTPEDVSSLGARVTGLEAALIEAESRPDSEARLTNVLSSAQSLAGKLNDVSDALQQMRVDADERISVEVGRLNDVLSRISALNEQILRAKSADHDYPALLDQQQKLIDQISELVPLRKLQRENDTVALYTLGGALLLDIKPAQFAFTHTEPITPDMTLASGALSGLTINGQPVATAGGNAAIAGGVLSELFAVRDTHAVELQSNLDEMARDLVSRFEDPTLDPTLAIGDPGLFTDRGAILDPLDTLGLAQRISVNAAVDPGAGGQVWRIRDGLGATTPGPAGDAALLSALRSRVEDLRAPAGGTFSAASKSVSGLAAALTSMAGQSLQDSRNRLSFETARAESIEQAFLAQGVDTDRELQKLLLIEQAYAANARVMKTADDLIQILMGL